MVAQPIPRLSLALVEAGADRSITDRSGRTPLQLAEAYGFTEIADIIRGE